MISFIRSIKLEHSILLLKRKEQSIYNTMISIQAVHGYVQKVSFGNSLLFFIVFAPLTLAFSYPKPLKKLTFCTLDPSFPLSSQNHHHLQEKTITCSIDHTGTTTLLHHQYFSNCNSYLPRTCCAVRRFFGSGSNICLTRFFALSET